MLSRVADSLYWMARYMERTDSLLRVLRTNYHSSLDDQDKFTWAPVLKSYTDLSESEIEVLAKNGRQVLHKLVFDRENFGSVFSMVSRSRENARAVQDNITKEVWQSLNGFYHLVRDPQLEHSLQREDPITILDNLTRQAMLYYGVCDITMFRGEGLCFMNLGKYLERAAQSINILDLRFSDISYNLAEVADSSYWRHLLLSLSGYSLYLKRYRSGFEAENIIDQVLFNTDFPKSVLYSINQTLKNFERLRSDQNQQGYAAVNFLIGRLKSKVQYSNVKSVQQVGLHVYLTEVADELMAVGHALNQHYFAYS